MFVYIASIHDFVFLEAIFSKININFLHLQNTYKRKQDFGCHVCVQMFYMCLNFFAQILLILSTPKIFNMHVYDLVTEVKS